MTARTRIKPQPTVLGEDKAWLLGHLSGDGGVYTKIGGGGSVHVYAGLDHNVAETCVVLFEMIYGVKASIQELQPGNARRTRVNYVTSAHSGELVDEIKTWADFGIESWSVPRAVLEGSSTIQGAWISGFFEAEGGVDHFVEKGTRRIAASTVNLKAFVDVKEMLEGLGIRVRETTRRARPEQNAQESKTLRFGDRDSIEKYAIWAGFRSSRKKGKLAALLASYAHDDDKRYDALIAAKFEGKPLLEAARLAGVEGGEDGIRALLDLRIANVHRDNRGTVFRDALPKIHAMRAAGMKWREIGRALGIQGTDHYCAIYMINMIGYYKKKGLWPLKDPTPLPPPPPR